MHEVQPEATQRQQSKGDTQLEWIGRERATQRPQVIDLLVGRHRPRREPDVCGYHLALAARTVTKGGVLGAFLAGGGERAWHG
jgi:hypothetical protein